MPHTREERLLTLIHALFLSAPLVFVLYTLL